VKISELIKRLEEAKEKYGDVKIIREDYAHGFCDIETVEFDEDFKEVTVT